MITRLGSHVGDDTCSAAVVAGDLAFLSHHAGGFDVDDPAHQTRAALDAVRRTLEQLGLPLSAVVQVNLYLRRVDDLRAACDVFPEYFGGAAPARTTITSDFVDPRCLVQVDAVALAVDPH